MHLELMLATKSWHLKQNRLLKKTKRPPLQQKKETSEIGSRRPAIRNRRAMRSRRPPWKQESLTQRRNTTPAKARKRRKSAAAFTQRVVRGQRGQSGGGPVSWGSKMFLQKEIYPQEKIRITLSNTRVRRYLGSMIRYCIRGRNSSSMSMDRRCSLQLHCVGLNMLKKLD